MQTKIANEIVLDPSLKDKIELANRVLEEELGQPLGSLTAVWRKKTGPMVELELAYFDGVITGTFTENELADPRVVQERIHRLWVDLLLRNSRRTTEELIQLIKEWKESAPVEGK